MGYDACFLMEKRATVFAESDDVAVRTRIMLLMIANRDYVQNAAHQQCNIPVPVLKRIAQFVPWKTEKTWQALPFWDWPLYTEREAVEIRQTYEEERKAAEADENMEDEWFPSPICDTTPLSEHFFKRCSTYGLWSQYMNNGESQQLPCMSRMFSGVITSWGGRIIARYEDEPNYFTDRGPGFAGSEDYGPAFPLDLSEEARHWAFEDGRPVNGHTMGRLDEIVSSASKFRDLGIAQPYLKATCDGIAAELEYFLKFRTSGELSQYRLLVCFCH
jgi:hypothetical protein